MVGQVCQESKALRFQRALQGVLLLGAYVLDCTPLIAVVALAMLPNCLSTRCSPLYRLGLLFFKSGPDSTANCSADQRAERFSCILGLGSVAASLLLIHVGKTVLGWSLVLLVGSLSVLAGTVGFCLGTVLYASLFRRPVDGVR